MQLVVLRYLGDVRYELNHSFFDDLSSELPAYYFGLFSADGYLTKSRPNRIGIDLDKADEALLQSFADALDYKGQVRPGTGNMKRLQWTSSHMAEVFRSYGIDHDKSHTLPKLSLGNSGCSFRDLFRGYTDGDGSWTYCRHSSTFNKRYVGFSLRSTPEFCQYLRGNCPVELNYLFSVTGVLYTKRKQAVHDLWHWLYDGASVYLPRKRNVYLQAASGSEP